MTNEISPRKLISSQECHIDNLFYTLIDKLSNICKEINLTPNQITYISIIPGFLSVYFLYTKQIILFSSCFFLYYILDILDGYYARKYSLCSKFGDLLDHARDIIIWTLIIIIIVIRLYKNKDYKLIILTFILLFLMFVHISCQEANTNINTNDNCYSSSLNFINLCPNKNLIYITRYFGIGFMMLYIILIVFLKSKSK